MKQTIAEEVGAAGDNRMSRQKSGFLCARRSNKRKKKEVPYSAQYHDDYEGGNFEPFAFLKKNRSLVLCEARINN